MSKNIFKIIFASVLVIAVNTKVISQQLSDNSSVERETNDYGFIETLRVAGVFDACKEMGIEFDVVFAPIATSLNHSYQRYRWSVTRDDDGNPTLIQNPDY